MYGMTFKDDLHRNTPGERWSDKNAKCHQLRPSSVLHLTLLFRIHHEGDDSFSVGTAYLTINEYICRMLNPQKTSSSFVPSGFCQLEDKTRAGDRRGESAGCVTAPRSYTGGCLWEVSAEAELWTQGQVTDRDGELNSSMQHTPRVSSFTLDPLKIILPFLKFPLSCYSGSLENVMKPMNMRHNITN